MASAKGEIVYWLRLDIEARTREALIALGWTPPESPSAPAKDKD